MQVKPNLAVRVWGAVDNRLRALRLAIRNRVSKRAAIGEATADVSLTSYGVRLQKVHLAIESIAAGRVRPRRLILWLADDLRETGLPRGLARLQRRGLEVRYAPDTRSFKKFLPYVMGAASFEVPLVTADDDVIYPRRWLADIVARHDEFRATGLSAVIAYRAHRFGIEAGRVLPYTQWARSEVLEPSVLNFATGVGGVLYPLTMLEALRDAACGFKDVCPDADDIWLHYVAIRSGHAIAQVPPLLRRDFPLIPSTQRSGSLWSSNIRRNDAQISATYPESVLRALSLAVDEEGASGSA